MSVEGLEARIGATPQEAVVVLSDKEVVLMAQADLSKLKRSDEVADQILPLALDNFDFIEQLKKIPAVDGWLMRKGGRVKILGGEVITSDGTRKGLFVSFSRIAAGIADDVADPIPIRREFLEWAWKDPKRRQWVEELGRMTKKEIVERFERAITPRRFFR